MPLREQLRRVSNPDIGAAHLSENTIKPLEDVSLIEKIATGTSASAMRAMFCQAFVPFNMHLPNVAAFHPQIPIYPDRPDLADVTVDVIVPQGEGPHPVLVYFHGGAWVAGNPATHRKLTYRFAEAGYLVASVDYRLAPEHPFPAAFDDCLQAVSWTRDHISGYGGDVGRLAIGGDSAGGNLAAAVCIRLRDDPRAARVRAALLIYGVFDFADVAGPLMSPAMHDAYLGRKASKALLSDPRVSPIHGAARLPPSYVLVGDTDTLLGDSRRLAQALRENGIKHEYEVVAGMPHAFMQLEFLGAARLCVKRMAAFLDAELAASSPEPRATACWMMSVAAFLRRLRARATALLGRVRPG